jgi:hypothetical protein
MVSNANSDLTFHDGLPVLHVHHPGYPISLSVALRPPLDKWVCPSLASVSTILINRQLNQKHTVTLQICGRVESEDGIWGFDASEFCCVSHTHGQLSTTGPTKRQHSVRVNSNGWP